MADYILLFGPPGVGKGSQAALLSESLGLPHIATGDLFRDNLKRGTPLGLLAKGYMSRGELVPDEVTVAMLKERLDQPDAVRGALLDGFPRTEAQAAALAHLLAERGGSIRIVLFISAPEEVLLTRLASRWTCGRCGAIYNAAQMCNASAYGSTSSRLCRWWSIIGSGECWSKSTGADR